MPILGEFPPLFFRILGPIFGLLWGSFLNVVIYRVPRGESVVSPPSHCPGCGTPIRIHDNLPVIGWLWLRGKARCCGVPISPRYPLVEAMGGMLAWAIVEVIILRLPADTSLARVLAIFGADLALALALVAASFIDIEHLYIPDGITVGGAVLGLATTSFRPPLTHVDAIVGALGGFLMIWLPFDFLYRRLRGRTGMAMGDAKLVMLAGAWFGIRGALVVFLLGSVQGALAALVQFVVRGRLDDPEAVQRERDAVIAEIEALPPEEQEAARAELKDDPLFEENASGALGARIPFGPFLALAMMEYLLVGREWLDGYLALLWW